MGCPHQGGGFSHQEDSLIQSHTGNTPVRPWILVTAHSAEPGARGGSRAAHSREELGPAEQLYSAQDRKADAPPGSSWFLAGEGCAVTRCHLCRRETRAFRGGAAQAAPARPLSRLALEGPLVNACSCLFQTTFHLLSLQFGATEPGVCL